MENGMNEGYKKLLSENNPKYNVYGVVFYGDEKRKIEKPGITLIQVYELLDNFILNEVKISQLSIGYYTKK